MENPKHLTEFKVENFKCFESFEMNGIGQFNLIVGDNNVGKTSVLEALLFDGDTSSSHWYWREIIKSRNDLTDNTEEIFDIYPFIFNAKKLNKQITFTIGSKKVDIFYKKLVELTPRESDKLKSSVFTGFGRKLEQDDYCLVGYENDKLVAVVSQFESKRRLDGYLPIVYLKNTYGFDLARQYSHQHNENKKTKDFYVNQLKQKMIPNLESMEVITTTTLGSHIVLSLKDIQKPMPLSSQGEGSIKLFRILLEISECSGERLMIDEVDAGIHYSRFKDYWLTILKAAKDKKVQLFMTTHSQECIKYLREALEELGESYQNKVRLISLTKSRDGNVKSFNFNYDNLSNNIELQNEMRD